MNGSDVRSFAYLSRLSERRQRRGAIWLAVLLTLVGGLSMAAIAAARRTESAYPAYLASSNATQLQVFPYQLTSGAGFISTSLTSALASIPDVAHVATSPNVFVTPDEPSGSRALRAITQGKVMFIGSIGGANFAYDRPAIESGTMATPSSPSQIVASVAAASLLGWHVGQRIRLDGWKIGTVERTYTYPPPAAPATHVTVTLVGLITFGNQVAHDDVDRYPTYVLLSPALTRRLAPESGFSNYSLRLSGGARDVSTVESDIAAHLPAGTVYNYHVTSVVEGQVQRAIRPEALALAIFGLIAGAAALVIGAESLRRLAATVRDELRVARAIGADRPTMLATVASGPLIGVLAGALGAAVAATLASPIAPLGVVRAVDPSPGIAADWTVLLAGVALLIVVLGAWIFRISMVEVGRVVRGTRDDSPRQSHLADLVARTGAPAPIVAGLRFSLQRGAGRSTVPVRSAFAASVVAVVVAVTTVTFASSLGTLDATPSLYGWNWNVAIDSPSGSNVPPIALTLLRRDPAVAAVSGYNFANATINNVTVPIILATSHAAAGLSLLAGHAVDGPKQVVLGIQTLSELHARLGGTVTGSYGSQKDYPVYVPPTTLHVVGIATMPAVGQNASLHTSMGVGAELSVGIEPPAFQAALHNPDLNQDGPGFVAVRFASRTSLGVDMASVRRIVETSTKVMDADPEGSGDRYVILGPQRPAEVVIYESAGATPALLAAALAVGATVALGLALTSSVRRRRRDLALLKTLGFRRRQLAATIAWQASCVAVVGALFGVPIGVALGRWLWTLFARQIGAIPDPTVPVAEISLIVVAAILLANAVAAIPGRIAARTPAALVLRSE